MYIYVYIYICILIIIDKYTCALDLPLSFPPSLGRGLCILLCQKQRLLAPQGRRGRPGIFHRFLEQAGGGLEVSMGCWVCLGLRIQVGMENRKTRDTSESGMMGNKVKIYAP
jgi:hypothetical protein